MNNHDMIKKNSNKGFSLVELIVVIAIMAVLVAVLAPSLLAYVERSRAQKDDSAMGEVVNAINIALADEKIYDEVLFNSCKGNVACYVDGTNGKDLATYGVLLKDEDSTAGLSVGDQAYYNDDARLLDETPWQFAGKMRGMTITFQPTNVGGKSVYTLAEGVVNASIADDGTRTGIAPVADYTVSQGTIEWYGGRAITEVAASDAFSDLSAKGSEQHYLYNRVRSNIGDTVELTSQTYRNSNYTVFIKIGSQGGNQASAQDAVKTYGMWGGTNLSAPADASTNS